MYNTLRVLLCFVVKKKYLFPVKGRESETSMVAAMAKENSEK